MARIDKKGKATINRQLGFSYDGHSQSLSDLVVAEINQAHINPRSSFHKLMMEIGVRSGLCSIYCIGSTLPYPTLKYNRFKPILHRIACIGEGEISRE